MKNHKRVPIPTLLKNKEIQMQKIVDDKRKAGQFVCHKN